MVKAAAENFVIDADSHRMVSSAFDELDSHRALNSHRPANQRNPQLRVPDIHLSLALPWRFLTILFGSRCLEVYMVEVGLSLLHGMDGSVVLAIHLGDGFFCDSELALETETPSKHLAVFAETSTVLPSTANHENFAIGLRI